MRNFSCSKVLGVRRLKFCWRTKKVKETYGEPASHFASTAEHWSTLRYLQPSLDPLDPLRLLVEEKWALRGIKAHSTGIPWAAWWSTTFDVEEVGEDGRALESIPLRSIIQYRRVRTFEEWMATRAVEREAAFLYLSVKESTKLEIEPGGLNIPSPRHQRSLHRFQILELSNVALQQVICRRSISLSDLLHDSNLVTNFWNSCGIGSCYGMHVDKTHL